MFEAIEYNILLFVIVAAVVWISAHKLTTYLDLIAKRTGLGQAFIGIILLGGATSLPEIVTTITASANNQPILAGSNLLGGLAMQIVVLACVDFLALKGKALTSMAPKAALLMQGVVLILIISILIIAISYGELFSFYQIGLWPCILMGIYLTAIYIVYRYEDDPRWEPVNLSPQLTTNEKKDNAEKNESYTTKFLFLLVFICSFFILVSGYLLTVSAESIVEQGGLSGGIVGATLLALATSLPEVTTTWSALKIGAYTMAVANILGTNALEIALMLPADIFYRQGNIINELGEGSIFLAGLGIVLTGIYLLGILERKDKTIFGMGIDSFIIIITYGVGITIYWLRF